MGQRFRQYTLTIFMALAVIVSSGCLSGGDHEEASLDPALTGAWAALAGAWTAGADGNISVAPRSEPAFLMTHEEGTFQSLRADIEVHGSGKAGIVYRFVDEEDFDVVWVDSVANEVRVSRIQGGESRRLGVFPAKLDVYSLEVRANGTDVDTFLMGTRIDLSEAISQPTRLGLYSDGGARATFSNVSWTWQSS